MLTGSGSVRWLVAGVRSWSREWWRGRTRPAQSAPTALPTRSVSAAPSEHATSIVEQADTGFSDPARQVSKPLTDHPAGAFQRLFRDNRGFVFATP